MLVDEAAAVGIIVEEKSFIETEPIDTIELQQEVELAYLQSATVVFTSMNAVEAVAAYKEDQLPDWTIYCIGNTTRQLVEKYFPETGIAGTAASAADLAELIVEEGNTDAVIFFCGDQRREELPAILHRNGIDVNEITVYQTITVPQKVARAYDGILFFSPTAVDSFFKLNKIPGSTIIFTIGNTTAGAVKKYCKNKIVIADEPGKDKLVIQMMEFFGRI
jgi:uroporphyrinogen-III synthase